MGTDSLVKTRREVLLEAVLACIKHDVACGDVEALDELLNRIDDKVLLEYLPEEKLILFLEKPVYQPDFQNPKVIESNLFSFQVYHSKENAMRDFPGVEILEYNIGDIEDPSFIDEQ